MLMPPSESVLDHDLFLVRSTLIYSHDRLTSAQRSPCLKVRLNLFLDGCHCLALVIIMAGNSILQDYIFKLVNGSFDRVLCLISLLVGCL